MKRLVIVAAVLGVAVPMSLSSAIPAQAGSGSAKSYKSKSGTTTTYVVRRGLFGNRRIVVRSKVKGFTARVGGYSFNVGKTFSYDPHAPRPEDWPRHDVGPSRHGIIPTSLYP